MSRNESFCTLCTFVQGFDHGACQTLQLVCPASAVRLTLHYFMPCTRVSRPCLCQLAAQVVCMAHGAHGIKQHIRIRRKKARKRFALSYRKHTYSFLHALLISASFWHWCLLSNQVSMAGLEFKPAINNFLGQSAWVHNPCTRATRWALTFAIVSHLFTSFASISCIDSHTFSSPHFRFLRV